MSARRRHSRRLDLALERALHGASPRASAKGRGAWEHAAAAAYLALARGTLESPPLTLRLRLTRTLDPAGSALRARGRGDSH